MAPASDCTVLPNFADPGSATDKRPPAGLQDILDPAERARVIPCLHTYCVPCLTSWAEVKRVCPLCKVRAWRMDQMTLCNAWLLQEV